MTGRFSHGFVILAASAIGLAAGPAMADTANVNINANIKGICKIDSIQSVDFGDLIQGAGAADKTAPGTVNYWCTKGVPYTVTLGTGLQPSGAIRQMQGQASTNSTEVLPYELITPTPPPTTGRGPQTPESLALQATVKASDYNLKSVGAFRDTVVVTVTP